MIAGFKDGVIAEKGTHNELMSKQGIYNTLVTQQVRLLYRKGKERWGVVGSWTAIFPDKKFNPFTHEFLK